MNREELHAAIQQYSQESAAVLGEAVLTKWIVAGEFLIPGDDLAFHRFSGQRDGRPLMTWEVDGLLFTALIRGRANLKEM